MVPVINIYSVIVADFIGIAILLTLLVTRGWNLPGRKDESRILFRMIIASVANCLIDGIASELDGRIGAGQQFYHFVLLLGNSYLYLYNILFGTFLVHMIIKHIGKKITKSQKICFIIICVIQFALIVINIFVPVVFEIDEINVYHRGPLFFVFIIVGVALISYGYVYYFVSKVKNPALRYFPVFEFFMPILLGLIIQTMVYGISLVPVSIAVSLIGIVSSLQNECIYIDKLTGVYNRFELDRELKRLQKRRKETIVAYMLDLNGFKRINDDYSHEEGDQALIAFAGILTDVFGSVGTVIRFAGDEFVALVYKGKESDIELYKQKTAEAVEKYNEISGKPYKLSAAVGGRVFDFSKEDTQDLVVVIDKMMYKDKDDYYKDHKRER